jgi:hypothetical protein
MKPLIAAGLIVVPLLIVAAIAWWPDPQLDVSSVLILPPEADGSEKVDNLLDEIPVTLSIQLKEISGLEVRLGGKEPADVIVMTALTSDSGILQLNIQAIDSKTHKEIWSNTFQSPRSQYSDMLRAAGQSLRRALD